MLRNFSMELRADKRKVLLLGQVREVSQARGRVGGTDALDGGVQAESGGEGSIRYREAHKCKMALSFLLEDPR